MANALVAGDTSPVYLRPDEPIPEDVDPQRVVFLKRVFTDPPEGKSVICPRLRACRAPPSREQFHDLIGSQNCLRTVCCD
jgi:hypothetical protein